MIALSKIEQFQLFCLECFIREKGISGVSAFDLFVNNNVFQYLKSGYDVLHTQDRRYIVERITDFINK